MLSIKALQKQKKFKTKKIEKFKQNFDIELDPLKKLEKVCAERQFLII